MHSFSQKEMIEDSSPDIKFNLWTLSVNINSTEGKKTVIDKLSLSIHRFSEALTWHEHYRRYSRITKSKVFRKIFTTSVKTPQSVRQKAQWKYNWTHCCKHLFLIIYEYLVAFQIWMSKCPVFRTSTFCTFKNRSSNMILYFLHFFR